MCDFHSEKSLNEKLKLEEKEKENVLKLANEWLNWPVNKIELNNVRANSTRILLMRAAVPIRESMVFMDQHENMIKNIVNKNCKWVKKPKVNAIMKINQIQI